ncbi:probable protein S-acyltransferase 4 [Phragmites australis]|uniref:probable protein S-acyltransferase 4 n=1 Tax=Phragmites australis TaxID=29695 RepID=UPI002D7A1F3C|nr:probable protein S-acyltransferase 4 [Phragmites australis]
MTSARDPGIVPRRVPPEADELLGSSTPSMDWSVGRTPRMRFRQPKDVIVNGFTVKVKFCETCLRYRPPTMEFPSIFAFLNSFHWPRIITIVFSCSLQRNYRYFFLFIATSTFLCIFVFIFSCCLTTYENFRYHYDKDDDPYRKSIAANFAEVFFTNIPPPLNDFSSRVGEGALEAGFYTPYIGLDVTTPRKKNDIDMDNKEVLVGGMQIPTVLQNIDYGSFEDSSDDKNRNEGEKSGHFPSAWAQGNEGAGTSAAATTACNDETTEDDVNEISSPNTSSTQTSAEANAESPGEYDAKESNSSNRTAQSSKDKS